jgi:hypothetical protein
VDDCVETAPARRPVAAPTSGSRRLPQLDNLRTGLIAWIIGGHALVGYSAIGGWEYAEVREVTLRPRVELVLSAILGPSALLVIGTFFFIAGLLVPRSVAKHGWRRFVLDRAVRLGVPYLAFALLLWPLLLWLTYRAAGRPVSYRWIFTERKPLLDAGPLWFVAVLLIFSVGYALLVRVGLLATEPRTTPGPLRGVHLVALAVGLALATFVVRLWFPARGTQPGDLHLWQWPQCAAMFGLGIAGAPRGVATRVPDRLRRGGGFTVLITVAMLPVVAALIGVSQLGRDVGPFLGGWRWQALFTATVEAVMVVAGSVWLLGTAQRLFTGTGRLALASSRGAYAAFIVQGPILLGLALAVRPLPVAVELKAFLVAAAGIAGSFWLGRLLVTRTPLGRAL